MKYESFSSEATVEIASNLAKKAKAGDIFCLNGDLGAGKTQFAKGFAQGLGIKEDITSPTFTIVHEYSGGRLHLYHFDVYRINSFDEMFDIGFDEMLFGDGICVIEWAEKIKDIIPQEAVFISIERGESENHRVIRIDSKCH